MSHHLAQINIARLKQPIDHPDTAEFVANLDRINELAETQDGFVWRLKDDSGNATAISAFDDPLIIVNMSVWRDIETLRGFVYKTDHLSFLRRRADWFHKPDGPVTAMWWAPAGTLPTVADGKAALDRLKHEGASAAAFSFAKPFPPPAADKSAA